MNEKIINNEKYFKTFELNNSNDIAKNVIRIIQEEYDSIIPIKKLNLIKQKLILIVK